jgi:hypothetical protein
MNRISTVLSLFAVLGFTLTGFSADPPMAGTTTTDQATLMKLTEPNENHKTLNDLVGKWNYTLNWWMNPGAKPEAAKGTSTATWVLGGRFVQENSKAKMHGKNFEGMGFTGYDNVKQEYQTVWIDNMSTGMMWGTGMRDTTSNTFTSTGTWADAMTNDKAKWYRTELKVVSKNEHVFDMYTKGTDGTEFKAMEITYHRAK